MNAVPLTEMSDDQLWQRSREGDREAFGQIVERYQSLICSLAYSACGNLARSEDLGQETFIAAWQKLAELREPDKLRAWLCGIVRNLAANALRREQRRGGSAKSLNSVAEPAGSDADPAAQAVTQEEATLLWRSLAGLPETYREPMVLFYRQGQSVAEVARSLDLAEEAVKQRLSRGRSMLREELASVVETTLTRTRPTGPSRLRCWRSCRPSRRPARKRLSFRAWLRAQGPPSPRVCSAALAKRRSWGRRSACSSVCSVRRPRLRPAVPRRNEPASFDTHVAWSSFVSR